MRPSIKEAGRNGALCLTQSGTWPRYRAICRRAHLSLLSPCRRRASESRRSIHPRWLDFNSPWEKLKRAKAVTSVLPIAARRGPAFRLGLPLPNHPQRGSGGLWRAQLKSMIPGKHGPSRCFESSRVRKPIEPGEYSWKRAVWRTPRRPIAESPRFQVSY